MRKDLINGFTSSRDLKDMRKQALTLQRTHCQGQETQLVQLVQIPDVGMQMEKHDLKSSFSSVAQASCFVQQSWIFSYPPFSFSPSPETCQSSFILPHFINYKACLCAFYLSNLFLFSHLYSLSLCLSYIIVF